VNVHVGDLGGIIRRFECANCGKEVSEKQIKNRRPGERVLTIQDIVYPTESGRVRWKKEHEDMPQIFCPLCRNLTSDLGSKRAGHKYRCEKCGLSFTIYGFKSKLRRGLSENELG
jgi:predicted RNA-binding Zn-ribbon protein involved in translation (DUF1610 family)